MGRGGDDGVVYPQPHPAEGGGSFDPGPETGYLRRGPREHELSPELGAAPFDPGPERYDERRARKEARRRAREQGRARERRERLREPAPRSPEPEPASRPAAVIELRPRREREDLRRPRPVVEGPVRRRARAAENRTRAASRRRGLFWPTAKAGFAATVVLALGAGLGSAAGLPVPGLNRASGGASLASSASLFGVDAGTPQGLSSGFVFPLIGHYDFGDKLDRFGAPRDGHIHEGQDIFGRVGTPEVAVHDGIVVDRGTADGRFSGGRGNYVAIYSAPDDHSFVYMHMLKPPPVRIGQQVHAGEVIGQLGCSGSCDGPHLHFEVRIGKATLRSDTKPVDPLPYLRQWPQATPG